MSSFHLLTRKYDKYNVFSDISCSQKIFLVQLCYDLHYTSPNFPHPWVVFVITCHEPLLNFLKFPQTREPKYFC